MSELTHVKSELPATAAASIWQPAWRGSVFSRTRQKSRLGKVPESRGGIAVAEVLQESEFRN
jgi:hypothetical protein